MIIGEGCFNEVKDDLVIDNYPNLEKIVVKKNSLKNLNSLKICNNEKLKTIEIEYGTFKNVKNVIIESISIILFYISNLPNLQSFKIGNSSFYYTESLSLSSIFNPMIPQAIANTIIDITDNQNETLFTLTAPL